MAITDPSDIHADLLAIQDSQSRRPLVNILSTQRTPDIPFAGRVLTYDVARNMYSPSVITLEVAPNAGRIYSAVCYDRDGARNPGIMFIYTDLAREEWGGFITPVAIDSRYHHPNSVSLCEMTDGNIGVCVFVTDLGGVQFITTSVYTVEGVLVSSTMLNKALDSSTMTPAPSFISDPCITNLGSDNYMIIYARNSTSLEMDAASVEMDREDIEMDDSPTYFLYKMTSTSTTLAEAGWSAETKLAITIPGFDSFYKINNPSVIDVSGVLFLWFDVTEEWSKAVVPDPLTNLYYSKSVDSGVTWSTAIKVTSFTLFSEVGNHPVAVSRIDNTMDVAYNLIKTVLHKNRGDGIWPASPTTYCYGISLDIPNRMIYVHNTHTAINRDFRSVVKINMDTWKVVDHWDTVDTIPQFPTWMIGENSNYKKTYTEGQFVVVSDTNGSRMHVFLLDGEANTITNYHLNDWVENLVEENVDTSGLSYDPAYFGAYLPGYHIGWTYLDINTNRLYLWIYYRYHVNLKSDYLCWIDITETIVPGGKYSLNYIFQDIKDFYFPIPDNIAGRGGVWLDTSEDIVVFAGGTYSGPYDGSGMCSVYSLSTGLLIWKIDNSNLQFPFFGLTAPYIHNGSIYAGISSYRSVELYKDQRGLVEINILTQDITYHRPDYCTENTHIFSQPSAFEDDKILMTHSDYGVVAFDTISHTWELWNNDTNPGMYTHPGTSSVAATTLRYDATTGMIISGEFGHGIFMFHKDGDIEQPHFITGNDLDLDTNWVFETDEGSPLVQGYRNDINVHWTKDPGTTYIWALWDNDEDTFKKVMWDKDGSLTDLTPFLINNIDVRTRRDVYGQPAALSFSISDGHVFDTSSLTSVHGKALRKGRKLSVKWGEAIVNSYFGEKTVLGSIEGGLVNHLLITRFSLTVNCTISSIWVYSDTAQPTKSMKAAVYNNINVETGEPDSLVATGTSVYGIAQGWNNLPFASPVTLNLSSTYNNMFHIGFHSDGAVRTTYGDGVSGDDSYYQVITYGDPLPAAWGTGHGESAYARSIYALFDTIIRTERWCNAGAYLVVGAKMSYQKGQYPVLSVTALDQRALWRFIKIYATENYANTPNDILDDFLEQYMGIDPTDSAIPTFVNETTLYHQWVDTVPEEIIEQICSRYGYFFRFDIDDNPNARQISNALAVDHVYSNTTKILKYSPDDEYANFVNQVIVEGSERTFTQITFPEESIQIISGTIGWYGGTEHFKIWYSEDRERRCIYPRMVVLNSSSSIGFELAGGVSESLTLAPAADDNRYCTVKIEAPNLTLVLIILLDLLIASWVIFDAVKVVPATGDGWTIPWGKVISGGLLASILLILSSFANWQIEVYAQPLGRIRRNVQGQWDDEDHQVEVGQVVSETIEEQLCYSSLECKNVADIEGMIHQMQRGRIKFEKMAHLQDEEGDTLEFVHPRSGQTVKVYICELERKYRKSKGYFMDTITGWVIT